MQSGVFAYKEAETEDMLQNLPDDKLHQERLQKMQQKILERTVPIEEVLLCQDCSEQCQVQESTCARAHCRGSAWSCRSGQR